MFINMTSKNDNSNPNQLPLISIPENLWDLEESHKRIAAKIADQVTLDSIIIQTNL